MPLTVSMIENETREIYYRHTKLVREGENKFLLVKLSQFPWQAPCGR